MRRLVLLCLVAVAATSAYNLVIQEIILTGGLVTNAETVTCDNIAGFHIEGQSLMTDCYTVNSTTDPTAIESINVLYTGVPLQSKKSKLNCEIVLKDQSSITFTLTPQMNKVGVQVKLTQADTKGTYKPLATTASPTTPTTVAPPLPNCDTAHKVPCICAAGADDNHPKGCTCSGLGSEVDPDDCTCSDVVNVKNPESCTKPQGEKSKLKQAKAVKKVVIRKPLIPVIAETTTLSPPASTDATMVMLPVGLRHRGPGPVRPPVGRPPIEDTVTDEDEEEERRIKRDAPPIDDTTINVAVTFYILDEAGNAAAVWAAVIEGIILIVLVGACFYFFCWAPRSRAVGAASADPYKEGPNYTVSYANSSFNNQRIDAFQNPPAAPAAPARPANSSYMDDYITDNIAARPAAAPAASAANPVASDFRPGHQRFDSSGLVTVNLS